MGYLREAEDDEDDDDEVEEGLSGFRADISASRHLRKELGGVRDEVGVSTEMSWQDTDWRREWRKTIYHNKSVRGLLGAQRRFFHI